MWSAYSLDLYSPTGVHVSTLEAWDSLAMSRTVNSTGALSLKLPFTEKVWDSVRKDSLLDVWRRAADGSRRRAMGTLWLVASRRVSLSNDGTLAMTLGCVDCTDVLRRWSVMAADGSAAANKTGAAETLMKAVVTDQLITRGGLTLTVEGDGARGYDPLTIACANQQVLSVVQGVAQSSTQYGTYLAFDVVPDSTLDWTFRVWEGQRGTDRTSTRPLVLSDAAGDIGEGEYLEDYGSAVSQVVCGGQTVSGAQSTATATNLALEGLGPFAHTEIYTSAQNTAAATTLEAEANTVLRLSRPALALSGAALVQTPKCQYGSDFDFGDKLRVSFAGQNFTARLDSLSINVDARSGEEKFAANLTGDVT
jgi:hypothetical protein